MGAKTALLAFAEGDIRPALSGATRSERAEAEMLVRQVHPGHVVASAEDGTLWDCGYPPDDVTYATALAGAELFCDRRLVLDRPSELPEHLLKAGAGRRIMPFHPLELGEDALRALFGFVMEGAPDSGDIDTTDVHLHGFRVTDPSGREQAEREAMYAEVRRTMGPPRMFRMGPDGTMQEVSFDDL